MIVRRRIVLGLMMCFSVFQAQAQKTGIAETKINFEELRLKGNNANTFKIGDSYNQIVAALGSPTSHEDFYFEMDEAEGALLKYSNSRILLKGEEFYTWTLNNNYIQLGRNGKYFKVGDTVDKVYEAFPEYSNKPVLNGYITIHLRSVNYDMECTHITIFFDGDNKVSKIRRHDC